MVQTCVTLGLTDVPLPESIEIFSGMCSHLDAARDTASGIVAEKRQTCGRDLHLVAGSLPLCSSVDASFFISFEGASTSGVCPEELFFFDFLLGFWERQRASCIWSS